MYIREGYQNTVEWSVILTLIQNGDHYTTNTAVEWVGEKYFEKWYSLVVQYPNYHIFKYCYRIPEILLK